MKIKLVLLQLILLVGILTFGQATSVFTCKGGIVAASIYPELSPSQITAANNQAMTQYGPLGITFLDNSSAQYNCHSYAWHLREGNTNRVWINNSGTQVGNCYSETHNIDKYWTDGCFLRVCNEIDAEKLHYFCGDHSAVKSTTNPGYYESKWGQLPVMRHTKTGVPYADPVNSVNYYTSINISGSTSYMCSGIRTFTVKNISGATYVWTFSSSLTAVGPINLSQLNVQRSNSVDGPAWVSVAISTPCSGGAVTRQVDFIVGSPLLAINYTKSACSGGFQTWNLSAAPGSNWNWTVGSVTPGSIINIYNTSSSGPQVNVKGYGGVRVNYNDACGVAKQGGITVFSSCGSSLVVAPNPATDMVTVTTTDNSTAQKSIQSNGKSTPKMFKINVVSKRGNILKTFNYPSGISSVSLNLSGLQNGTYTIQTFDKVSWTSQQIVILR